MQTKSLEPTLISLVHLSGGRVHRTKLVKLVYLTDLRFHELTGQTLTGLRYMWDNYGPNAVSNAIVKEADRLVSKGVLRMSAQQSAYGTGSFRYWTSPEEAEQALNDLGPGERQVVRDIAREFGKQSVKGIVAASKQTAPFSNAEQYDVLEMEYDEAATRRGKEMGLDDSFREALKSGLRDAARGNVITQEELDQRFSDRAQS